MVLNRTEYKFIYNRLDDTYISVYVLDNLMVDWRSPCIFPRHIRP
jgi:hypothetical protein